MKKKLLFSLFSIAALGSKAQTIGFSATEYLDVNRFNAAHMVNGVMWRGNDTASKGAKCEYPKGTGKHVALQGTLWMSGIDDAGKLHISAESIFTSLSYYPSTNDYWPGPLDAADTVTYLSSYNWAKIWKINRADINVFLATPKHTLTTTQDIILTWPAKGNIYAKGNGGVSLSISSEMAPFVDVNGDGIYNPLDGDYPDMKGDQMLWWVFSDNGATHNNTKGRPLGVECHAMVYGYNRGSAVDNMMFYEFTMYNKSPNKYTGFRLGFFANPAIGNPYDDYIGFDSTHRMAVTYNSALSDTGGGISSYGYHAPMTGLSFVEMPGDVCRGTVPAGSFDFFTSVINRFEYNTPNNDSSYNNYMHAKTAYGQHIFRADLMGRSPGSSYTGNYVYPNTEMCDSNAKAGNRKYVLSTNDYTFLPNSKTKLGMVFIATDTTGNACGHLDFTAITHLADTAWNVYCSPLPALGVRTFTLTEKGLNIYPNPAQTMLFVETGLNTQQNEEQLLVYDVLGKALPVSYSRNGTLIELHISNLASGVYSVVYINGTVRKVQTFVKQ
jgi:hypothetical protein